MTSRGRVPGPGEGSGLTLLQQGPQDAGKLQEDSSATAGVNGPVYPAVPVVSVQHIAVWREQENKRGRDHQAWRSRSARRVPGRKDPAGGAHQAPQRHG